MTDALLPLVRGLADFGTLLGPLLLPLAVWSAGALVLWLGLVAARRLAAHRGLRIALDAPRQLRLAQAALFALPATLALTILGRALDLGRLFEVAVPLVAVPGPALDASATALVAEASAGAAWPPLGWTLLGLAACGALGVALVRLGLVTLRWTQLRSGRALPATHALSPALRDEARALVSGVLGARAVVTVRLAEVPCVPFVAYGLRPTVVLPPDLADDPAAFRLALRHELTHIARGDLWWALAEQVALALTWWHPLAHGLAAHVEALREETCDAEVIRASRAQPQSYARLLAACSERAAQPALALSLPFARPSHLRHRITLLLNPTPNPMETPRFNTAIALALFACLAVLPACTDMVTDGEAVASATDTQADMEARAFTNLTAEEKALHGEAFVVVEQMPELIGGLASIQNAIVYPEIAKKAGIEGRVFVQFIVDKDGSVRGATVVRGIGGGCDEAALAAVNQASFVPGKQRGQTVPVKMSIPVTFELANDADAETTSAAPADPNSPSARFVAEVTAVLREHTGGEDRPVYTHDLSDEGLLRIYEAHRIAVRNGVTISEVSVGGYTAELDKRGLSYEPIES